jgi:hypothetical protein
MIFIPTYRYVTHIQDHPHLPAATGILAGVFWFFLRIFSGSRD